jgi:hypothetical protein
LFAGLVRAVIAALATTVASLPSLSSRVAALTS